MFYRTLVVYLEDGLHTQAPWVKISILSCFEVFTVSIDRGSDITSGVSISIECVTAYLHRTHLKPTRVCVTTLERPMSYTPKTEECPENLDPSFGYSEVSVDIPECPLNYRLQTQEQPVPTDDPSLTRSILWSLNT